MGSETGSPKLDHSIFRTWASWIVHFLNLGIMNELINDELATSYKVMYTPNLPTTILLNHKSLIQIVIWIVKFYFVNAS